MSRKEIHVGLEKQLKLGNFLNYQNILKSKELFDLLLESGRRGVKTPAETYR